MNLKRQIEKATERRHAYEETPARHNHPITPGSAEGELEVVEKALKLRREGGRRPSGVKPQGNRKKAA